jgi:hypothetical protein
MMTDAQTTQIQRLAAKKREATAAKQPAPKPWKARKVHPALTQNELGEWLLVLGEGAPLPATDAEVALWLALQDARKMIEQIKAGQ